MVGACGRAHININALAFGNSPNFGWPGAWLVLPGKDVTY
jgi:hypothetical protein